MPSQRGGDCAAFELVCNACGLAERRLAIRTVLPENFRIVAYAFPKDCVVVSKEGWHLGVKSPSVPPLKSLVAALTAEFPLNSYGPVAQGNK
jgi:hypothetical protein